MNRGVWIGALAAGLGGLLSNLSGQESAWRAIQRPVPASVIRGVSAEPGASIGRPVAVSRGASADAEPPPFPTVYQQGAPVVPALRPPEGEPIAVVPPPGAVIATSSLSPSPPRVAVVPTQPVAEEPSASDLFASDRSNPAFGRSSFAPGAADAGVGFPEALLKPGPEIVLAANWEGTYPVTQPPVGAAAVESVPEEQPLPRFYLRAEYLLWWMRRDHAPPLATSGDPQQGVNAGNLGQPGTMILDNGELTHEPRSGGRFFAGYFLDCEGTKAIEVGGFFLGRASQAFTASSGQFPVLTRPFFDLNQGVPLTERVAFPGIASGNLSISSPSDLAGLEANLRCKWCCGCDYRINLLAGFRYLSLNESLTITEDIQTLAGIGLPNPQNGTRSQVQDSFATSNQFYGGQVGVDGRWQWKRFTVDGMAKLALGVTEETIDINGFQRFPPGTPGVDPRPGGLLALNSNIGHFTRSQFSVVPEVGVTLGYYLTENVRATIGYNFLYWSNVVRPGEQIDTNIDITRIPNFGNLPPGTTPLPGPHPAVLFKDTDFWAQGLTFGIEITF